MSRTLSLASSLLLSAFTFTACVDQEPGDPGEPGTPVLTAPARVDLGAGDCGGAATGRFVLANDGDAPLSFELESVDPRVAVLPVAGTIPAGESQTIEVEASVPEAARAGEALTAALLARVEGGATRSIDVAFAARGAMFSFEPSTIAIGEQPIGRRANRTVTVRNLGNLTGYVAIASAGGEFGGGLTLTELDPGSEASINLSYVPRDLGVDVGSAAISFDGPVCGARPAAIELSGEGVAGGGVLVQGGPVEFGTVTCDGADETRTLTLVNPTDLAVPFTAQLWDDDLDDVNFEVRPAQGAIPARGQVELTVKRRDARGHGGPREYHSTVRIVTSLGGEQIHDVAVHERLQSAELRIEGETDFGWLPAATNATIPVLITNTGDAPARLSAASASGLVATVPAWLDPGASAVGWIQYSQPTPVLFSGDVVYSALGSCQHPVERTYTAGRGGYALVSPVETISACGGPPTTSARLWVANPGTESLEIRCRAAGPSPLAVSFAQSSIVVPAGDRRFFDVTMAAGDGAPGTVTAPVECIATDGAHGAWEHHETSVSRTNLTQEDCEIIRL